MIAIGLLFVRMLCDFFMPRLRLEAEILILRHQLNVLQQRTPRRRLHLRWVDRALFIWLYRRYPSLREVPTGSVNCIHNRAYRRISARRSGSVMHSPSDRHSNALARYLLAAALIRDLEAFPVR